MTIFVFSGRIWSFKSSGFFNGGEGIDCIMYFLNMCFRVAFDKEISVSNNFTVKFIDVLSKKEHEFNN